MVVDEGYNVRKRCAAGEDTRDAKVLEPGNIFVRNHASHDYHLIAYPFLTHFFHELFDNGDVGTAHYGESYNIHILLDGNPHNLIDGPMEARVNHFHACLLERMGHYFGTPVVAVESGLGYQYLYLPLILQGPLPKSIYYSKGSAEAHHPIFHSNALGVSGALNSVRSITPFKIYVSEKDVFTPQQMFPHELLHFFHVPFLHSLHDSLMVG